MVKKAIINIILEITGVEDASQIKLGMSLRDDLNMDEGEIETLLEAVESEFDVDLLSDGTDFETVGELITYIDYLL